MISYYELKRKRRYFNNWKRSPAGKEFIKRKYKEQNGKCAVSELRMFLPPKKSTISQKLFSKSALYWKMATVDHIIPLSQGGKNETSNYRLVTRAVNMELSRFLRVL